MIWHSAQVELTLPQYSPSTVEPKWMEAIPYP